jgi:hypothetical protein
MERKRKKRLDVDLPAETRDGLAVEAHVQRTTITALATTYIQAGLSREQESRLELQSFPLLREAVQVEMRRIQAEMRQEIQTELARWTEVVRSEIRRLVAQSSSRQAALAVKSLRESETTRRMLVLLAEHLLSLAESQELYEQATSATNKHLAVVLSQPED